MNDHEMLQKMFPDHPFYNHFKQKPIKKKRECLKCRESFISRGPQNRICSTCDAGNNRSFHREVFPNPELEVDEVNLRINY